MNSIIALIIVLVVVYWMVKLMARIMFAAMRAILGLLGFGTLVAIIAIALCVFRWALKIPRLHWGIFTLIKKSPWWWFSIYYNILKLNYFLQQICKCFPIHVFVDNIIQSFPKCMCFALAFSFAFSFCSQTKNRC